MYGNEQRRLTSITVFSFQLRREALLFHSRHSRTKLNLIEGRPLQTFAPLSSLPPPIAAFAPTISILPFTQVKSARRNFLFSKVVTRGRGAGVNTFAGKLFFRGEEKRQSVHSLAKASNFRAAAFPVRQRRTQDEEEKETGWGRRKRHTW